MATPRKKPEDKLKVGRKSTYDPALCAKVIAKMSEGLTMTAASGELGFYPEIFWEWSKKHPEFANALKEGRSRRVAFLERGLLKFGASKDSGRVTARIFALKCAQSEEWRERPEEQPVNVHIGEIKVKIVDPKR
jgi:hypothetical protein